MVSFRALAMGIALTFAATATTSLAAPFPVARSLDEVNGAAGIDLVGRGSAEMAVGGIAAMDMMLEKRAAEEQELADRDVVNPPVTSVSSAPKAFVQAASSAC